MLEAARFMCADAMMRANHSLDDSKARDDTTCTTAGYIKRPLIQQAAKIMIEDTSLAGVSRTFPGFL
jgi:hypothetical protein